MTASEREAFTSQRRRGVGGSDAASLWSVGYGCRRRLYYDKAGVPEDYPQQTTNAMQLGIYLEEFFAQKYAERTGHTVRKVPRVVRTDHPMLGVNVDRVATDPMRAFGDEGDIEIKSMGLRAFLDAKQNGVKEDYILQINWEMMVSGRKWGAFAIGCRDSGELLEPWVVERDEDLCKTLEEAGIVFWAEMQAGHVPDALDPDDRRCQSCAWRKTCQGNALIQIDTEGPLQQDETLRPLLMEFDEHQEMFKQAEELFETTKTQIKDALGTRAGVLCAGRKIYHKPQARTTWQAEQMAAELARATGMVDFDGTFVPRPLPGIETKFKVKGREFRTLRVF